MTLMTNRQTYQDDNQNPKKPETPDFSKFNVHDSFSVPTTDTTLAGGTPDSGIKSLEPAAISDGFCQRRRAIY